jgi:hypothetical protein
MKTSYWDIISHTFVARDRHTNAIWPDLRKPSSRLLFPRENVMSSTKLLMHMNILELSSWQFRFLHSIAHNKLKYVKRVTYHIYENTNVNSNITDVSTCMQQCYKLLLMFFKKFFRSLSTCFSLYGHHQALRILVLWHLPCLFILTWPCSCSSMYTLLHSLVMGLCSRAALCVTVTACKMAHQWHSKQVTCNRMQQYNIIDNINVRKKCSGSGTGSTQPREYKLRSYLIEK